MPIPVRKIIKDPVLGEIVINDYDKWVLDLIQTREFQRMRNILQLGATHFVFPGATHNRFSHLLGTFEIARKLLSNINKKLYTEKDRKVVLAAAILHDIGHGPSSHSFEYYTNIDHEFYTCKIILSEKSEINKMLRKNSISPKEVVDVLTHKAKHEWMSQVISSQLDADRLDYLIRDSFYTGTIYGLVDREYIISSAAIVNDKLVFAEKAIHTIENYLLNRYHMYVQIYENKSSLAWECLIHSMMHRAKDLYKKGFKFKDLNKMQFLFIPWFEDKQWTIEEYYWLTDLSFSLLLASFEYESDPLLSQLGHMYNRRENFKILKWTEKLERKLKSDFSKSGNKEFAKYNFYSPLKSKSWIYSPKKGEEILLISKDKEIYDISKNSLILKSANSLNSEKNFIIYNAKTIK